jgi:hypothetical protein
MKNELAVQEPYETTSLESALMNLQAKTPDKVIVSPNEFLASVFNDGDVDMEIRIKAATAAKKDNGKSDAPAVAITVNNDSPEKGPVSFDMDEM